VIIGSPITSRLEYDWLSDWLIGVQRPQQESLGQEAGPSRWPHQATPPSLLPEHLLPKMLQVIVSISITSHGMWSAAGETCTFWCWKLALKCCTHCLVQGTLSPESGSHVPPWHRKCIARLSLIVCSTCCFTMLTGKVPPFAACTSLVPVLAHVYFHYLHTPCLSALVT